MRHLAGTSTIYEVGTIAIRDCEIALGAAAAPGEHRNVFSEEGLGCGCFGQVPFIIGVNTDQPKSQLVHTFRGNWCGVPTIAGHYLVQSAGATHGLIVLDIANPAKPVEVFATEARR